MRKHHISENTRRIWKRCFALLLTTVMLLSMLPHSVFGSITAKAATVTQYIDINGTFTSSIGGWKTAGSGGTNAAWSYAQSESRTDDGSTALQFTSTGGKGYEQVDSDNVTVLPDTTYTLTYYIKQGGIVGARTFVDVYKAGTDTAVASNVAELIDTTAHDGWTEVTQTFTTGSDTSVRFRLYYGSWTATADPAHGDYILIDDLTISCQVEATEPEVTEPETTEPEDTQFQTEYVSLNGVFSEENGGWKTVGSGGTNAVWGYAQSESRTDDGSTALQFTSTGGKGYAEIETENLTVRANTTYTLTYYVKQGGIVGARTFATIYKAGTDDAVASNVAELIDTTAHDGWTEITQTFTTGEDTSVRFRLYYGSWTATADPASGDYILIDDLSISCQVEVTEPEPTETEPTEPEVTQPEITEPTECVLLNGVFSEGKGGWKIVGSGGTNTAWSYAQSESRTDDGSTALQFTSTGGKGYAEIETDNLMVRPNTTYTLTYYVKQGGIVGARTFVNVYKAGTDTAVVSNVAELIDTTAHEDWVKVTQTFTTGEDTSVRFRLYFGSWTATADPINGDYILIDDLSVSCQVTYSTLNGIFKEDDGGWTEVEKVNTLWSYASSQSHTNDGSTSLQFKASSGKGYAKLDSGEIPIKPNTQYVLTYYVKQLGMAGATTGVDLYWAGTDECAVTVQQNVDSSAIFSWQEVTQTITVPTGAPAVRLRLYADTQTCTNTPASYGYILIDDLTIKEVAVDGTPENSLPYNGGFDLSDVETQTAPGWNLNADNENHTVTVQNSVIYGNSGYALKLQGETCIYATDFAVEPGASYLLSYWVRVDAADALVFAPFVNDSNYSGTWQVDHAAQAVRSVTDSWKRVTGVVTVPESVGTNTANPDHMIQLGFKAYQGSGTIYLDVVSFVKTDIGVDDPNYSFEQTQSGVPLGWQTESEGVQLKSDPSIFHAGSHSMYIDKSSLEEISRVDSAVYIPVSAGNIYEFSFWMCSGNAEPTANIKMVLRLYGEDGTALDQNAVIYGTTATLNSGAERSDWTKVVTRSAIPEGAVFAGITFELSRGSAEIWVDDIFCNVVENGVDCVVYYEDFHAVDEEGNISSWQHQGEGSFTAENGGKLTVTAGEGYIFDTVNCLATDYTYCIKGKYSADIGGTVQVRFYDYRHEEYVQARKTVPILASGTEFTVNFTAPSHTYAAIYIGTDQAGTVTVSDVTVYMTAQPPAADRNYTDADWTYVADRDNVVSSVEMYNGIPTLMIDGQPTAPYFYVRPDANAYLQTDAESRIAQSGLELYVTYGGSLYREGCDPIWLSDGSIDYAAFDAVIYDTLAANDDALVMVNFGMFAPSWWIEENPEHEVLSHNGSEYIAIDNEVSMASEKFREEAGEVLRQLISHMKQQPYYNRVFGIKIGGGQSYEWLISGTGTDQGPDYSEISQAGFKTYLQNKYETIEALQAAWGNNTVTFETAAAPGWDERCASSNVYLGDAITGSLSRNIVDWNLYLSEASADSFLYYCQIAKEETEGQIIVGGYNGYLWTSNSYDSQGTAHTAMDRVLRSEYVDWIASPLAYNERLLGESSAYMALLDSVQAHGKLYIAELDNRTCLSESYTGTSWDGLRDYQIGQTHTMADTIYQQKRDFANALVNGAGLWQYDMRGGWLDDPQIYQYIADAKAEYDLSVYLDRNTTNEVAVFVGDETYAYLTAENENMSFALLEPMLQQQRKHLAAMGAGYDTYAMSTLLEGKVPPHKLNIVLSPFEITEQMQLAIDTYLKTDDQVVVWVYLPGISTGTELSLSNVERTTGFSINISQEGSTLQVQLADAGHTLTEGISGLIYGNSVENRVSPMAYIADTSNATVLGYNLDGGKPGLAVKDMGSWTSVYSSAPCLNVELLRKLLQFAGCHVYSENSADVIYSSNHYVALHSATAGEKTVLLPGSYSVYDVFEEKLISPNTNLITYEHLANDTHIFRLMPANTYAVTASIQEGKGTLSAPGLTQVAAGESYSLTVTPEFGYQIAAITVNAEPAAPDANGILTIPAVNCDTVIEVSFSKDTAQDNWGFEYGSFGGGVTGSGTASVVSDEKVQSGLYSLRLNHDGTAGDAVEMTVYMNASAEERTLTVSYWAKTAYGAVNTLHTSAQFFSADWNSTQASVSSTVRPSESEWTLYSQELILSANTEIFRYQIDTNTENADVYIDGISVTCDGQQMLINGGLERGNLTGSFTKCTNTPEIVRAQSVHAGSYSASLSGDGVVTAELTELNLTEETPFALSAWLQIQSGAAGYRIRCGEAVFAEGVWNGSAEWTQQSAAFTVPAGTQSLLIEIYPGDTQSRLYLDDLNISALSCEKTAISFTEVSSDGTWRFAADHTGLLTDQYYKLPVVVDGSEQYVVIHNTSNMLCVYPDYFGVYGGTVPVVSMEIPAGAVLKPVSPDVSWGETEGQWIKAAQAVTVKLAEGSVKQWNVSLGGDLTVNFYTDIRVEDLSTAQVLIAVAGKTYSFTVSDDRYDEKVGAYRFSVQIAAAQMTDEISVQLLYSGVEMWQETYTVRQYADYVLADESMSSYHSMVRKMLHYGGAAQSYFDYRTGEMANEGIADTDTASVPATVEQEMSVEGQATGISFYGASMLFRHQVAVRYYFKVSGLSENYTFTVNGISYEAIEKDGLYYVELPGVNPQNWDEQIVLTVKDGADNTLTVSYSPMNYIVRMNQNGLDALKLLLKAMYNYHLAAKSLS